jgi:chorismate mutase
VATGKKPKYYLVDGAMLPEIFLKVTEAKELLETGEASTVAEAVSLVGISRSAFYKYKDAVSPFQDMKRGRIITFHIILRDRMGVLSTVLAIFANSGANILTINQSIPTNGAAIVTISAETTDMTMTNEELLTTVRQTPGVIRAEVLAG